MPKSGQYPHIWKSGADPIDHKLWIDCQRARAQAWFRGQDWFITEQEYVQLWREDDRYLRKGRTLSDLCLCRRDADLPWTLDNVEFKTREEHYKNTKHFRGQVTYGPRKPFRKENARSKVRSVENT